MATLGGLETFSGLMKRCDEQLRETYCGEQLRETYCGALTIRE